MANNGGTDSSKSTSPSTSSHFVDPVLRNALRYTISAEEYRTLHEYIIKRSPQAVRRRTLQPGRYDAIVKSKDDYTAAAFRASLRIFVATQTALKLWDVVSLQLLQRGKTSRTTLKASDTKSPNFRLSLSVSLILLLHRVLHRFFSRLRSNLLIKDAAPFRKRNPRISKLLTSRLAPSIGASLAGFALGVYPGDQLRIAIAIYIATRAAEFLYNALETEGWFKDRPWWFGSWMLMPPVFGQLFHAFIFDRDCFPKTYTNFILDRSSVYVQARPPSLPANLPWPSNTEIVDGLAEISKSNWPPFTSPILFPNAPQPTSSLTAISPITSTAHPLVNSLSCALLHPSDPSCIRTYISHFPRTLPSYARFFTLLLTIFALPKYKLILKDPGHELNSLAARILRMSLFVGGAVGTSWGTICLFQSLLPRTFLPTQRFFLSGFISGFWAFLVRSISSSRDSRDTFLYTTRLSLDSLWRVGVKRGWWKAGRNRDVWAFVGGLMVLNAVFEIDPRAVDSGFMRRVLGMLRGEGWRDRVTEEGEKE
ncbi:MAG: hypothetical protein MMC33_004817 [Icmadophila ericetorum]|nr:hypothetical protein [Icmadophila ericetorum]